MRTMYPIKKSEFNRIRDLIKSLSGINLSDSKKQLVVNRLSKRVKELKFETFDQYISYLDSDKGQLELATFINKITTNKTGFFRENDHFVYLRDVLNRYIRECVQTYGSLKILSAACSTGEEPYTIAMTVADILDENTLSLCRVDAVDINTEVLDRAKEGIYPESSIGNIDFETKKKFFLKGNKRVMVKQFIKDRVYFKNGNLLDEGTLKYKNYDIIFCRNMMIYLDKTSQAELLHILFGALKPSGYLFTGHSENLNQIANRYEIAAPSIYKKLEEGKPH